MVHATAHDDGIESCGLTFSELEELWLGPSPQNGSLFSTEAELVDAWNRGRDVVMRLWAHSGRRPAIWWELEAAALGLAWPGYDRQPRYLYEAGVLEETEKAVLEQTWRRAFDRGHKADLPPVLRRQWKREKKEPRSTVAEGPQSA